MATLNVIGDSTRFDIAMSPMGDGPLSEEMQSLALRIDRTMGAVRELYKAEEDREQLQNRFNTLTSLAQAGLVGEQAVPTLASTMLDAFRAEIVEREAGRQKRKHMLSLGIACLRLGIVPLGIALVALIVLQYRGPNAPVEFTQNLGFLLAACAAGVWVSFGARKATYTFEDLTVPERDYLSPHMRAAFAFILTTVLALLFHTGAAVVSFGKLSTDQVLTNPLVAVLVGFLCGFSEQVLAKSVTSRAEQLLGGNAATAKAELRPES